MSLVALSVHFGAFFIVVGLGIWLERRTGSAAVYRSLPGWAQFVTAGVAFGGPWIPFWRGEYPASLQPDPLLWVLGLNAALWIGTPLVLQRFVDTRRREATC